jgi:DNA-directed RNA polymerase subunit RPC12/RpoP
MIYNFFCEVCKKEFEHMTSMTLIQQETREGKVECPKCSSNSVTRLYQGDIEIQMIQNLGIYEQIAIKNKDGSTTIFPAARKLRAAHTRTIPTTIPEITRLTTARMPEVRGTMGVGVSLPSAQLQKIYDDDRTFYIL